MRFVIRLQGLQAHAKAELAIEDRITLLNRALAGGSSGRARFIRVLLFSLAQTCVLSFACIGLQAHAKAELAIEDRSTRMKRTLAGGSCRTIFGESTLHTCASIFDGSDMRFVIRLQGTASSRQSRTRHRR